MSLQTTEKPDLGSLRIDDHKRTRAKTGKRIGIAFAILLGALVVTGGVYAYMHQKPLVDVIVVQKAVEGPQALLNASGYVTPQRRATVAAKITGRVTGVFFEEGMYVHQGFVLATLDDSDLQKALASARADHDATEASIADLEVQVKNANIQLHRAQELQAAGVQTQEALDNARMAADSLKAKIAVAKEQVTASSARIQEAQQAVDNCTIRAPFDGVIVSKDAQVGEMVSPISAGGGFTRTGIATIVDMASNEIEVDVNENYIARVKPGQDVTAVLDAYPDWQIPAHVHMIIPTADRQKATVTVRIKFKKLDPKILPDMGVKVSFMGEEPKISETAPLAIAVPQNALRDDAGQKVVYLLKGDHVERRAVKVGANRGSDTEILAGLGSGDTIVVNGPADLHDGETVAVRK